MGRRELTFWTVLAFFWALLAVAASLWAGVGQRLEERKILAALEYRMEAMGEGAIEKQLKIAKWYNWSLEQGNYVPEWDYESILNLGEGRMGLLSVPELKLALPISHGVTGPAGHDPETAFPTGGSREQTVLYIEKTILWREGMAVKTVLPGAEQTWLVESIQVMPAGWPVDHPAGRAQLTLVTDRGDTRTIVRCRPGQVRIQIGENPLREALFWAMAPLIWVPVLCFIGKMPEKLFKSAFKKILRL